MSYVAIFVRASLFIIRAFILHIVLLYVLFCILSLSPALYFVYFFCTPFVVVKCPIVGTFVAAEESDKKKESI